MTFDFFRPRGAVWNPRDLQNDFANRASDIYRQKMAMNMTWDSGQTLGLQGVLASPTDIVASVAGVGKIDSKPGAILNKTCSYCKGNYRGDKCPGCGARDDS